ncbi:MAG: XRE family transcriptional regulator [Gemmatimonadaceae bacterium]
MAAKALYWLGSSLEDTRDFPEDARRIAGHQLHLVQLGLQPDDWKPMPSVGAGVYELRVHTEVEHRVFYIAKYAEGVYVLHAFEKHAADAAGGRRAGPAAPGRPGPDPPRGGSREEEGAVMAPKITRSSGNVFQDLGFGADEAEHLRIRSALMATLRKLIKDRGLTQAQAATLFGVSQPRVSDLVRGKIDLFSIDTLVDMLARAGLHVELVVGQVA